jgi:hypothetical protein
LSREECHAGEVSGRDISPSALNELLKISDFVHNSRGLLIFRLVEIPLSLDIPFACRIALGALLSKTRKRAAPLFTACRVAKLVYEIIPLKAYSEPIHQE